MLPCPAENTTLRVLLKLCELPWGLTASIGAHPWASNLTLISFLLMANRIPN